LSAALKATLQQILDYAGLFPPAQLSLEESFANYRAYLGTEYNWMLSKFVCPAGIIDELARLLQPDRPGINISVLVSEDIKADISRISGFIQAHPKSTIETVELKISETLLEGPENVKGFLENTSGYILSECKFVKNIFFEVPLLPDWKSYLEPIVSALAAANCSFKLRTGSTDPSVNPPSEQIASVINTCNAAGVKLKFTAGLHHPFRSTDPETGTVMHGFLNVFCAAVLAHEAGMTDEELIYLLDDFRPEHFSFSDTELTWFEYTAPVGKIEKARKDFVISFGSCSFEEPINDLKSYGLL
jgi:hypothetical protein